MTPRISPLLAVALLATLFVDCAPEIGGPPVPRRRGEDDLPRPRYAPRARAQAAPAPYVVPEHRPAPDDAPGHKGPRRLTRAQRKAAR